MARTEKASFRAQTTTNGRVTIPTELRETMHIDDGDYVELQILAVIKPVAKEV